MTHFGLKIGDRVRHTAFGHSVEGEVIALPPTDTNRARIRVDNGPEMDVVAEWCDVLTASPKSPTELAAEMQWMADLHPNSMWSIVMSEGAAMLRSLAKGD